MKYPISATLALALIASASPLLVSPAQALSCLPTDMYLADIVGKDDTIIFTATAVDQIMEKNYTAEVLEVKEVKQGYVENKIFAFHQKDENWGYLCNNGPKEKGSTGVYVATRDNFGKYNITQRLAVDSNEVKTLESDLKKEKVTGEVAIITTTDRMNQIMTTITELFAEVITLLKEYSYWKDGK